MLSLDELVDHSVDLFLPLNAEVTHTLRQTFTGAPPAHHQYAWMRKEAAGENKNVFDRLAKGNELQTISSPAQSGPLGRKWHLVSDEALTHTRTGILPCTAPSCL